MSVNLGITSTMLRQRELMQQAAIMGGELGNGSRDPKSNPASTYAASVHDALSRNIREKMDRDNRNNNIGEAMIVGLNQARGIVEGAQNSLQNSSILEGESKNALLANVDKALDDLLLFLEGYKLDNRPIFKDGTAKNLIPGAMKTASGSNSQSQRLSLENGDTIAINGLAIDVALSDRLILSKETKFEMKDSSTAKTAVLTISIDGKDVYKLDSSTSTNDFKASATGGSIGKRADINLLADDITTKLKEHGVVAFASGYTLSVATTGGANVEINLSADAKEVITKHIDKDGNDATTGNTAATVGFNKYNQADNATDILTMQLKQRNLASNEDLFTMEWGGKKLEVKQGKDGAALASGVLVLKSSDTVSEQVATLKDAMVETFGMDVDVVKSQDMLLVRGISTDKISKLSVTTGATSKSGVDISVIVNNTSQTLENGVTTSFAAVNHAEETQFAAASDIWRSSEVAVSVKNFIKTADNVFELKNGNGDTIFSLKIGDKDEVSGSVMTIAAGGNISEKLQNAFSQNSTIKGAKDLFARLQKEHQLVFVHLTGINPDSSSIMMSKYTKSSNASDLAFTIDINGSKDGPVESATKGIEGVTNGYTRVFPNGSIITMESEYEIHEGAAVVAFSTGNKEDVLNSLSSAFNKLASTSIGDSIGISGTKLQYNGDDVMTIYGSGGVYMQKLAGNLSSYGVTDGSKPLNIVHPEKNNGMTFVGRTYAQGALGSGRIASGSLEITKGMMTDGNTVNFAGKKWHLATSGNAKKEDILVDSKSLRNSVAALVTKLNGTGSPFAFKMEENGDKITLYAESKMSHSSNASNVLSIANGKNEVVGVLQPQGGVNDKLDLWGITNNPAARTSDIKFSGKLADDNIELIAQLGNAMYSGKISTLDEPGGRVVSFSHIKSPGSAGGDVSGGGFSLRISNTDIHKAGGFTQAGVDALVSKLNGMAALTDIYSILDIENLNNSTKGSLLEGATAELHLSGNRSLDQFKVDYAIADGNSLVLSTTLGLFKADDLPSSIHAGDRIVFESQDATKGKLVVTFGTVYAELDSDSLSSAMNTFFSTGNSNSIYEEIAQAVNKFDSTKTDATKQLEDLVTFINIKLVEQSSTHDRVSRSLRAFGAMDNALTDTKERLNNIDHNQHAAGMVANQNGIDAAAAAFTMMLSARSQHIKNLLNSLQRIAA
ncbi:hypothetical protein Cyrtocomes_00110 [Candidatus Cyrtobacter comes]|uniref:Flagellin n=1 Tax=Candidatus Cyrtobacter comes TaxID=675776 RepID=A0ABU5L6S4_9RICK|nr:hypothetical protein [Candidatus Cyrtobacter comes]MDZ5761752.1 hypothetical protein [Candidatus Cyrtobacter comes]